MPRKKLTVRPSGRPPVVFAGIDVGASHSEIVLVDKKGTELGRVRGGPAAVRPDNVAIVARKLTGIVRQARIQAKVRGIRALVVAAAGAGRLAERTALEKALGRQKIATKIRAIGDGEAALESAFPGTPGVIVLSGTGSIAFARDRSGTVHRIGGLGWQMGDEGSGYALGRAALGAAGKAAEGRGPATALLERVLTATAAQNLEDLVRWAQRAVREEVAALAQVVGETAVNGDRTARQLLDQAAADLAAQVDALLRKLAPTDRGEIVLGGGLLSPGRPLRVQLSAVLSRIIPDIQIVSRTIDPALGAARLATRL